VSPCDLVRFIGRIFSCYRLRRRTAGEKGIANTVPQENP
jgi:hypothetical protein